MSNGQDAGGDRLYQVDFQNHVTRVNLDGQVVEGVEITFTIPATGGKGRIFVEGNPPPIDVAQNALRDYATNHLAIQQLSE
jgi:hypothetical protein